MSGMFSFIGWIIIIIGLFIGFAGTLFTGGLGVTIAVPIIASSIFIGGVFLAIAEVMNRLERIQVLQSRANEIHEDILKALREANTRP